VPFTPFWNVQAAGGAIDSTGKFTAGAVAGTFANTVRACNTAACPVGGVAGFATVTITPGALATLTVTPNPVTVGTGARVQFTAIGRDAGGNIVPVVPVPVWSVVPGRAGGTILSGGGYQAPPSVGVGIDTVVATSGAITGVARVNIVAGPALASLSITPNPATLAVGAIQQFPATGLDQNGIVVAIPNLAWTVVNGGGSMGVNTGAFTAGNTVGLPCTKSGAQHLADNPALLAQNDLTAAYLALTALPCGTTITTDLGGTTLPAGSVVLAGGRWRGMGRCRSG
jgi:hypothetical protein